MTQTAKPKGGARLSGTSKSTTSSKSLPHPFIPAPKALSPFTDTLPKSSTTVYITHIDPRPATFKRNIFLVPISVNIAVVALFCWRMWVIAPYYFFLLASMLGYENHTTIRAADLAWGELARVIGRRTLTFMIDFLLAIFVWPWPYEFVFGASAGEAAGRGSPALWRWKVGFREKEVYVRRSRSSWSKVLEGRDILDRDGKENREAREAVIKRVREATQPMILQRKTGYVTMDGEWDLDWKAMVDATKLVDKKEIELEEFGTVALLWHEEHGWISIDLGQGDTKQQEQRRKQLEAFRKALAALDKEELFFRWVEMIQFETTQPGGFTPERQVAAAKKVRDMFHEHGVDFDGLWKEAVGTDGLAGMP
ncbi:uncharacterized protein CTHT_0017440 [Thermochaetoides thermophila DSM 1495]|uniref:Uncharacterized protein n=1 Tax=Chaetomium thermophilum (strain DSM 1495 / CBS 144.50 / IMI 039719) TaxID=759272 RepID=G0S2J4_CHATD|nr:hypothetical protein CTHT_0017440 [Thermochaetoides thermophila DSM 1495]EGS22227.1 hypothetical protein CTHT_0017440 [Thermochaetoides thermophila DSM 1495]